MVKATPPFLSAAVFAAGLLALGGCETVQFGPDTADPTDTVKVEATLLFANKREADPGPLVLLLYARSAQDIENAIPSKEYPPVAFDASATLKIAPGRYKLAYRMESGDLRAMPSAKNEGLDPDWPVVTFASGKTYHLLIETDEGNITLWRHDLSVAESP